MFTGIIEERGNILSISSGATFARLRIGGKVIFDDLKLGDSVSVNGVCLTATVLGNSWFEADVMPETMTHSSLGVLRSGSKVNLERAMPADGRFGGHFVSGHIDGTGIVQSLQNDGNAVRVRITAASDILQYIVQKGSIAIDGISLTVTDVDAATFGVSIIPHTGTETTLLEKVPGDVVNLENDILGKYVKQLMTPSSEPPSGGVTMDFLIQNGF